MSRSPARRARPLARLGALVLAAAALAGCSGDGDDAAADLAERASAGLTGEYTAAYRLESAPTVDLAEHADVRVWRTPGSLRLDLTTSQGVARSITTADGVVACQTNPRGVSTCLDVAGPDEPPRPAFYPALNHLFDGMLEVFADRTAEVDVETAEDVQRVEDGSAAPPDVAGSACFRVRGEPPAPVTVGTYCLSADGVPTAAVFESGRLTLTDLTRTAPAPDVFAPPVSPTPLPAS